MILNSNKDYNACYIFGTMADVFKMIIRMHRVQQY